MGALLPRGLGRALASRTGGQPGGTAHELTCAACVQLEEYQYSDPVTNFVKEFYVEFDFEVAQRQLQLAERIVGNDFFLSEFREEFLDNPPCLISEAYCRIHQRIDIACVVPFS